MMNIGFFLKEPRETKETMVYITVTLDGQRLKRSTGVKVKPSQWNSNNNTVRPLAPDSETKNLKISNTLNMFKDIEREMLLKQELVTYEKVCKEFEKRTTVNQYVKSEGLLDIFEKFIESKKPTNSENTIKTYNTVKKHLDSFSKDSGFVLEFENFDLNFYDNFVGYFLADDYLNSSIGKFITIIKTFLNWAYERGIHKSQEFKKFGVFQNDTDRVLLTPEIVEKLRTHEFSNRYENAVRDVFILSAYTGLRFADMGKIKQDDYNENFLKVYIQKTRETLEIPLLKVPKEILDRHFQEYGRLVVLSNQFCNRKIKELFKKIEFDTPVKFTKSSGRKNIVTEKPAYDYLSMHYGRVFFITNSLTLGMNEETIRKITGHKDYDSFKKYVRFSKDMVAGSLKGAWED